jgi:hypothetical protein
MDTFAKTLRNAGGLVQRAGPYLLLELLMPGGTLFALLLYVYRSRGGTATPDNLVRHALSSARRTLVQPFDITAVANVDAANDADGLGPIAMMPVR